MRRHQIFLLLLLLSGLAIRLALAFMRPDDLTADSDGYLAHAGPVAQGHGFQSPYADRPTAFRPPAYPIILASLRAVHLIDRVSVLLVNLLASLVIGVFTWKLARQSGLGNGCSLFAVGLVVADPLLLRYSILPMTEVLCAAGLVGAVYWFRIATLHETAVFRPALLSGLMFGLGSLVRPVVMISCGLLTLQVLAGFLRRGVRMVLLVPAVIAVLVLVPWVIRNAVVFHRFIPATTHGGYTLALGNNPDFYRDVINGSDDFPWDGDSLDAWQQRMILQTKAEGVSQSDEPALDAFYYRIATEAIRSDPDSFVEACGLRLRRFWAISGAESANGLVARVAVSVWYGLLWFGLLVERVRAWQLRNSGHSPRQSDLWLVVMSFMLMHSVYWTDARMRAPLMPILIVLSVCGWQFAIRRLAGREAKTAVTGE